MGLFSRFFGRRDDEGDSLAGALVANPAVENPLSLQLLMADPLTATADQLTKALRSFDPATSKARAEIDAELSRDGNIFFRKHALLSPRFQGRDAPRPHDANRRRRVSPLPRTE